MPSRQSLNRLTLVAGGRNLGVWDDKTGGDSDSNTVQYFLGGAGPRISLGGTTQVANVVLSKLEDDALMANAKWLLNYKGPAVITQQKLDDDGNPVYEPFQWTGRIKRAKLADVSSQGTNTPSVFEVEMEVDGLIA